MTTLTLHTRGCSPRGTVRLTPNAKGSITGSTRKLTTAGGIEVSGYKAHILCVIRTGTEKQRYKFRRFCEHCGLWFRAVHDIAQEGQHTWETTYEIVGGPALERLTRQAFVVSWSYVLDSRAPHSSTSTFRNDLTPKFVRHYDPSRKA